MSLVHFQWLTWFLFSDSLQKWIVCFVGNSNWNFGLWKLLLLGKLISHTSLKSTAQYVELQKQHTEAIKTVHEQKTLVSQLERDLLSVNALSTKYRGEGEVGIYTFFSPDFERMFSETQFSCIQLSSEYYYSHSANTALVHEPTMLFWAHVKSLKNLC